MMSDGEQVMIRRLPEPYAQCVDTTSVSTRPLSVSTREPYAECVDTTSGQHDFTRNVYEELYPETLYSSVA